MSSPAPIRSLERAIERARVLLFDRFRLSDWLVYGLAVWLARIGLNAVSLSLPFSLEPPPRFEGGQWLLSDWPGFIASLLRRPAVVGPLVTGVLLLWVVGALAVTWLSSRFRFVFLDQVMRGRPRIRDGWHACRPQAHALFRWRIGLWMANLAAAGALLLPAALILLGALNGRWPAKPGWTAAVAGGGLYLAAGLLIGGLAFMTHHFAVPLMYRDRCGVLAAWRRLGGILRDHGSALLLFVVLYGAVRIALGACLLALALATCCCAGILASLPFFGSLLLLPVHVALRAWGVAYLADFEPGLDWAEH